MSIAPLSSYSGSGSLMATAAMGMQRASAAVESAGIGVVEAFGAGTSTGRVPAVDRVELSSTARATADGPDRPADAMVQMMAARTQYSAAAAYVKAADEVSVNLLNLLA
jgi:hypothetical protein